ncbi:hypothetical protein ACIQCR_33940 [Streptomyces sp. NPDC093249]|uniref:hypothetical protein n=1 Tax=unclassified Streptomyces TaxID=2593676 RepID=UPI0037F54F4B
MSGKIHPLLKVGAEAVMGLTSLALVVLFAREPVFDGAWHGVSLAVLLLGAGGCAANARRAWRGWRGTPGPRYSATG